MAASLPFHLILFIIFFSLPPVLSVSPAAAGDTRYPAIFGFGNSLTDTGNLDYFSGDREPACRSPYGETYFHHPAGRYSDGRLVIDFLAQALGLPLLPPYLAGNSSEDLKLGANFAVGGACALSNAAFAGEGMDVTWQDYSLGVQLEWFGQMLSRSFPSPGASKAIVRKSVFFVGEMGINDYTHLLFNHNTRSTAHTCIPTVDNAIGSMVDSLVREGARTLIVAGIMPLGCSSLYLTFFQPQDSDEYESDTGCLEWVNEFVESHNLQLQKELNRLRKLHSGHGVRIIYADYYNPVIPLFVSPQKFGLKEPLAACCGGEGPYNFSFEVQCDDPAAMLCGDPSAYVFVKNK